MITAAETRAHIFELVGAGLSINHAEYDPENVRPLALELSAAIDKHVRTIWDARWTPEYANALSSACSIICGMLIRSGSTGGWSQMALQASQIGLI